MERQEARKIADKITFEEIEDMLEDAKNGIKNWEKQSTMNKGLSKGAVWNILAKPDVICHLKNSDETRTSILHKTNLIREFGEYLPAELKPVKKPKQMPTKFHHEEPIFE